MPLRAPWLSRVARREGCHTSWPRKHARPYSTTSAGPPSWWQPLQSEMLQRPILSSREYIDKNVDHKLTDTLRAFLPQQWCPRLDDRTNIVPLGHHLIWFNASLPVDKLLLDGTDPLQSPGGPWVRRMWAGGSVRWRPREYYQPATGFAAGSSMVCTERISNVQLRGQDDAAKILVTVERRFARLVTQRDGCTTLPQCKEQHHHVDWEDAILKEDRILVFLRERTPAELDAIRAGQMASVRYLQPPGKADFSHTLIPTRSLLFRYSALTFNAHLIHLDREYARSVEGHRNLLVHGPLSLTLLLQAVTGYVQSTTQGSHVLESIEYRNLAPLYCDEEMRICGMEKNTNGSDKLYEVWIEGPTGGVAVKGSVRAVRKSTTGSLETT